MSKTKSTTVRVAAKPVRAKTSQKQKILNILESGKTLTQHQAKTQYKIASLSSRVNELRKEGTRIVSNRTMVRDKNTGVSRSVVRYGLAR